ncbi:MULTISPECIES: trypco2 family protein [Vibrio]|nr:MULTISPECIES: trypco2 family protein [Vibrio]MCU8395933.1 hypothetical protein [Vibrio vulnificus]AVH34576.1 hypothetical protein AL475_22265 [Vibrio fluvialis]EME3969757.1 hypothetical protein [Vibrio fluvialis]MCU8540765.1 hypothetical protein [Vibrio vulnificus]MCU8545180.1 hypothetical protein [Vibrio vulnificus]
MELQGFISQTIQEIARGVLDAKEKLSDTNAVVNPQDFALKEGNSVAFGRLHSDDISRDDKKVVQKLEFDIAITVDETSKSGASGKISVLSIGVGGETESTNQSSSVSRVKFVVPMVFPDK